MWKHMSSPCSFLSSLMSKGSMEASLFLCPDLVCMQFAWGNEVLLFTAAESIKCFEHVGFSFVPCLHWHLFIFNSLSFDVNLGFLFQQSPE